MSENTCIFCSKQSLALLQCSGCGNVHYCDKACQKSHWKLHKKDCKPFRICEIAGKNKGIVATKTIRQGQVIIRDRALLILKKSQIRDKVKPSTTINFPISTLQRSVLFNQFKALSAKDQKTVLSLHHEDKAAASVEDKILDVFESNGIEVVPADSICLYSTIPR